MERFNVKKLNDVEGREKHSAEISSGFSALETVDVEVDIKRAWETIRRNINILVRESLGCYELKKHKP
jgi:hypothetical protein